MCFTTISVIRREILRTTRDLITRNQIGYYNLVECIANDCHTFLLGNIYVKGFWGAGDSSRVLFFITVPILRI